MPCNRRRESEKKIFSTSRRDAEKQNRALRREDILIGGYRARRLPKSHSLCMATSCFLLCRNASLFFARRPSRSPGLSISLRRQIHPCHCTRTRTSRAKQSTPDTHASLVSVTFVTHTLMHVVRVYTRGEAARNSVAPRVHTRTVFGVDVRVAGRY